MKTYPAPWGKLLIGLSALSTLICVGVSVVMLATADRGPDDPRVIRAAAVLPVLIVAVAALFSVRGYEVTPDEIVVTCQNERSQLQNKATAMNVLRARLLERELERQAAENARLKGEHRDAAWGNQIRSYVLDDRRVKDHRTNVETSNTQAVLDGDIDLFIEAYLRWRLGQ